MLDPTDLDGLLRGYLDNDTLARQVLIDLLGEEGDPRAEAIRTEPIDWNRVAADYQAGRMASIDDYLGPQQPYCPAGRLRWHIDCARHGAGAPAEVIHLVRDVRVLWLALLFPECPLG